MTPRHVVILDEAAMSEDKMLLALLGAARARAKVVMVGDHRQLGEVGAGTASRRWSGASGRRCTSWATTSASMILPSASPWPTCEPARWPPPCPGMATTAASLCPRIGTRHSMPPWPPGRPASPPRVLAAWPDVEVPSSW
ncbi:MAG: AAA family ATPase [Acidimicrobiales bacterium]